MERYPDPGPPFPAINDDHVWLFHGTTPSNADAIRQFGWGSPDPDDEVRQAASANALPQPSLDDWYARFRYERAFASCSTGWRQAADYSRRGPEFRYYLSRAVAAAKTGIPTYETNEGETNEGAVILLAVPWAKLADVEDLPSRSSFLPDAAEWDPDDIERVIVRAPHEVLIPPLLFDSSIVVIDLVARECSCAPNLWLGAEPTRDLRLRCSRCFDGESN
jgi:hypothetical protein